MPRQKMHTCSKVCMHRDPKRSHCTHEHSRADVNTHAHTGRHTHTRKHTIIIMVTNTY